MLLESSKYLMLSMYAVISKPVSVIPVLDDARLKNGVFYLRLLKVVTAEHWAG